MSKRSTPSDRNVTGTSMLVSISDVTLNFIVGLITGSQVLIAQSLQGLSDLSAAVILFVGVDRSKKAPDKLHPLGYGREIYFWVLMAGMLMFLGTGLISFFLGLQQVRDPGEIENVGIGFAMLTFGFLTNFYAFNKSRKRLQGRKKRVHLKTFMRSSKIETKATFLIDFLGTISAFLGIGALLLFVLTDNAQFDGLGSMLVGFTMMAAAGLLIYDVKGLIVGRTADPATERAIVNSLKDTRGIEEVLDLRTLYLGSSKVLVLLEVHFDDTLSVNEVEQISDEVKEKVRKKVPNAYHIQVEAETPDSELS